MTITDDDIKRLRALCEAATPGPWFRAYSAVHAESLTAEYSRIERTIPEDAPDEAYGALPDTAVAFVPVAYGDTPTVQGAKDGDLMAAARTALPALLEEVERLRLNVKSLLEVNTIRRQLLAFVKMDRDKVRAAREQASQGRRYYADRTEQLEREVSRLHNAATLIAGERDAAVRERDGLGEMLVAQRACSHRFETERDAASAEIERTHADLVDAMVERDKARAAANRPFERLREMGFTVRADPGEAGDKLVARAAEAMAQARKERDDARADMAYARCLLRDWLDDHDTGGQDPMWRSLMIESTRSVVATPDIEVSVVACGDLFAGTQPGHTPPHASALPVTPPRDNEP